MSVPRLSSQYMQRPPAGGHLLQRAADFVERGFRLPAPRVLRLCSRALGSSSPPPPGGRAPSSQPARAAAEQPVSSGRSPPEHSSQLPVCHLAQIVRQLLLELRCCPFSLVVAVPVSILRSRSARRSRRASALSEWACSRPKSSLIPRRLRLRGRQPETAGRRCAPSSGSRPGGKADDSARARRLADEGAVRRHEELDCREATGEPEADLLLPSDVHVRVDLVDEHHSGSGHD